MNLGKLAPWNWFRNEEEGRSIPVSRVDEGRRVIARSGAAAALERIRREVDRMVDRLFAELALPAVHTAAGPGTFLTPRVDIRGDDSAYTLTVDLPGLDEKGVDVELSGDLLTVKAEMRREEETRKGGYHRLERSSGLVRRQFSLPDDALRDGIAARMKNGVLTVTIPRAKAPERATRKVRVSVG